MGFMTGERYQCQECEEILVMPIEFDNTDDYLEFLKVQSPEKFTQLESELRSAQNETVASNSALMDEMIVFCSRYG